MTNVRIDANGLSKAPVYDPTVPLAHRSAVGAEAHLCLFVLPTTMEL